MRRTLCLLVLVLLLAALVPGLAFSSSRHTVRVPHGVEVDVQPLLDSGPTIGEAQRLGSRVLTVLNLLN